ncbi:MAG TPA: toll/interleukin-1 receptor domain-containing protein, partial [Ktedonobacterales bacterium]|nr:toll/interleukin-1 receptor domain-containing protein [Ktedonobacterales bacterium]
MDDEDFSLPLLDPPTWTGPSREAVDATADSARATQDAREGQQEDSAVAYGAPVEMSPADVFAQLTPEQRAVLAQQAQQLLARSDDPAAQQLALLDSQAVTPVQLAQMYERGELKDMIPTEQHGPFVGWYAKGPFDAEAVEKRLGIGRWSGGAPAPVAPAPVAPAPVAPAPVAPAPGAPGADAPTMPPAAEPTTPADVAFTGYYPRAVAPRVWESLLLYIAVDTARARAEVEARASSQLGMRREAFRVASAPSRAPLRRGTQLTIVPWLPGFRFNPPSLRVTWDEDVQLHEFRLRAESATAGTSHDGFVRFFEGPLLRGEVPLAIAVRRTSDYPMDADRFVSHSARGYRNTFPSYSRKDAMVVQRCERVAQAGGDRYLRDVNALRAGEHWEPRLLELITQADVFQLFWSPAAARSEQVKREWRHALTIASERPDFIRPMFWTPRVYRPIPP